jgi:hypothetical protein
MDASAISLSREPAIRVAIAGQHSVLLVDLGREIPPGCRPRASPGWGGAVPTRGCGCSMVCSSMVCRNAGDFQ